MSHLNVNGVDKPLDHIYVNTGSIVKEAWEAKSRVILHGLTNPLCGISTYKDTLDLSTGTLTRYVKKLVLDGTEDWACTVAANHNIAYIVLLYRGKESSAGSPYAMCSHYRALYSNENEMCRILSSGIQLRFYDDTRATDVTTWKSYLAAQYTAGHPVTVWYVLTTPATETITLPSNLTGIVEGYLTQSGTPTPTNPIYPTANGTLEQDGTYSLDTGAYAIAWGRADTFTGTNSISARCYGLPVKSWEIDGNSQQSGVPSPQSIIIPEFVGVRTGNLWGNRGFSARAITSTLEHTDANTYGTALSTTVGKEVIVTQSVYPTGDVGYRNGFFFIDVDFSKYEIGDKITLSFDYIVNEVHALSSQTATTLYVGKNNNGVSPMLSSGDWKISGRLMAVITIIADMNPYVEVRLCGNSITVKNIMLNTGSTALPYESYGHKISITSAGQTVPVYLGQVPTTRRVEKLVLDGTENWALWSSGQADVERYYYKWDKTTPSDYGLICTHFRFTKGDGNFEYIRLGGNNRDDFVIFISKAIASTVEDFKAYLATQYANGTPVTAWYTLATPETSIINEPLCKIGDYVDTLTSDQAGVTIPTTNGNNTISIDTALSPSRFEIKVHAKPITKPIHYGFKIDKSVSDPSNAVIYTHDAATMTPAGMDFTSGVFDYGSWENVWFIKNARPVMLNFDGTEAYDLDPDDYSKKLDGTPSDIADSTKNMNAMIAFPTVWIKRTDDGSYNYIEISDQQIDSDFHAYAHEDANGVVKPYIYLPIYKGSLVDGKLRSISGVKPQSSTTAQQEVDAASALGTGWQIWDYTSKEMLCDLLTLISKSLDTQGKFGQGHSYGGSSASDFLNCGTLNDKGKFFGYSATTSQVKCFGMEALWAERWDRELGLILDAGIYKIKEHPAYNLTGEGYIAISTSVAKCPTSNNYIKTEVSTQFGSLPTVVDGTASTYYCDYFYQNQSGIRVALRGGLCVSGASAGCRSVIVNNAASYSAWHIGASPVYK